MGKKKWWWGLLFFCVLRSGLAMHAQTIKFVAGPGNASSPFAPAVVADIDGDGWLETLGTLNDGAGNLLPVTPESMGLGDLFVQGRPNDIRMADFNGDDCPDLIAEGYSSMKDDTRALLYINDCAGHFVMDAAFAKLNLRGRGEGLAVADFNNDGYLDIFLPYYTFEPCNDDLCPNSPQAYLFLNDGKGHFREVSKMAGVSFAGPPGITPEGTQAVDIDDNGLVDLYVCGHLLLNKFLDATNTPHFEECDCGLPAPPTPEFPGWDDRADEGFKFLDWNNDGLLDMVVQNWGNGPPPPYGPPAPPGPTLYQNMGTATRPAFTAQAKTTDGMGHPFFSTGAPDYELVKFSESYGVNAYDMDNDGMEDVITGASGSGPPSYPNTFFRNTGHGYEQVPTPDVPALSFGVMGFGDVNGDGKIDLIYSWPDSRNPYYFLNASPGGPDNFLSIEVLGPNGERNQQGRVVQVQPPGAGNVTYTRVVDSGSGYHAQNQYALLVGTPYTGPHVVTALFAKPDGGVAPVTFSMNPGEHAKVMEPPSLGLGVSPGGSSSASVPVGGNAAYVLRIGGKGLGGTVTLSCSGAPATVTCSVPASVIADPLSAASFQATADTMSSGSAGVTGVRLAKGWMQAAGMFIMGVFLVPGTRRKRMGLRALPLLLLLLLCSCGGGSIGGATAAGDGTPVGVYTMTITANLGSSQASMPITLIVQ